MKAAMKARDKDRLSTIRLIQSEFKRIEVDERIEIDDARALAVLDKMVKQRRDSAQQYTDAGREELAARENAEIAVLQEFLPTQLSEAELIELVDQRGQFVVRQLCGQEFLDDGDLGVFRCGQFVAAGVRVLLG